MISVIKTLLRKYSGYFRFEFFENKLKTPPYPVKGRPSCTMNLSAAKTAETLFGYAALSRYHPNSRQKAFVCANMPCRLISRCNVRTRRVLMNSARLYAMRAYFGSTSGAREPCSGYPAPDLHRTPGL